jgi:hypothetical protein
MNIDVQTISAEIPTVKGLLADPQLKSHDNKATVMPGRIGFPSTSLSAMAPKVRCVDPALEPSRLSSRAWPAATPFLCGLVASDCDEGG